jgi:hypothetical protein
MSSFPQSFCNGALPRYCGTGVVARFDTNGLVIWATYLGGTNQNGETGSDSVDKVLVDSHGNVWVSGHAGTLNFPVTSNAYKTTPTGVFLAELSPDGDKLLYSTYMDGELLAIDQHDSLYLTGVSKFDPSTNRIIYTVPITFAPVAAVADDTGFYVAGYGSSSRFAVTPGVYSHPSAGSDIALMRIPFEW